MANTMSEFESDFTALMYLRKAVFIEGLPEKEANDLLREYIQKKHEFFVKYGLNEYVEYLEKPCD